MTTSAAMEVILGLSPLGRNWLYKELHGLTAYTLAHSQTPISKSHDADHQKLPDEVKKTSTMMKPSSAMVRNQSLNKK